MHASLEIQSGKAFAKGGEPHGWRHGLILTGMRQEPVSWLDERQGIDFRNAARARSRSHQCLRSVPTPPGRRACFGGKSDGIRTQRHGTCVLVCCVCAQVICTEERGKIDKHYRKITGACANQSPIRCAYLSVNLNR